MRAGEPNALPGACAGTTSATNSASAGPLAARRLRPRARRVWWSFGCGALLNILNVLLLKGRGKMPGTEIQLTP